MSFCCNRIARFTDESDNESEYDTTNYIKLNKNSRNTSLAIKGIVDEQYWNLFLN